MIVLVDALRDDPADAIATKHVIAEVLAGDGWPSGIRPPRRSRAKVGSVQRG
jgi:hypothetical protein